jgi:hypothetical protein
MHRTRRRAVAEPAGTSWDKRRVGPLGRSSKICKPLHRGEACLPSAVVGTADINGIRIHARGDAAIKEVDIVTITAIEDADVVMVDVI